MTEPFNVSEALQQVLGELTGSLHTSRQPLSEDSGSYMYLDSKTINLVLLYILMNKELQLTRQANRNMPAVLQKTLVDEIETMIEENKTVFTEILDGLKK